MSRRMSRAQRAISAQSARLTPVAGIEVEHQPVGVARLAVAAEPPLRHVDLQRRQLGQPGQGGQVVDHRVVVVVITVGDLVPRPPSPGCPRPDPC